jgi:hypothetical protein
MITSKWLAFVCVFGTAVIRLASVAEAQKAGDAPRATQSIDCVRGRGLGTQALAGNSWRTMVWLRPCVARVDAERILNAINSRRLVDRQLNRDGRAQVARGREIPGVRVDQVASIRLVEAGRNRSSISARYDVMIGVPTRTAMQGLSFMVALRGDDVEIHEIAEWVE